LHEYDPSDLQKSFEAATGDETPTKTSYKDAILSTVQDRELAQAQSKGLLVDVRSLHENSPTSVVAQANNNNEEEESEDVEMKELDKWDEDKLTWAEVDSDDDLL
jgi:hypothetical protein